MTQITPSFISLLPPLYRNDNGAGESNQLASFTELLDASRSRIEGEIEALYASWFVETCSPADLASRAALTGLQEVPATTFAPRRLVADHAGFNAAKGTSGATSQAIEALGGWACSSVLDPSHARARITVDQVRVQTLKGTSPRFALETDYGTSFWFNPLGKDTPLYRASGRGGAIKREADTDEVSANIQLFQRSKAGGEWHPIRVFVQNLSTWEGDDLWSEHALVDPQLGRLWLPGKGIQSKDVMVRFSMAAILPVDPVPRLELPPLSDGWHAHIHRQIDPCFRDGIHYFNNLKDAFEASQNVSEDLHFTLLDSASHVIDEVGFFDRAKPCPTDPNRARQISISARQGEWPTIRGDIVCASKGRRVVLELNDICLDGRLGLFGNAEASLKRAVLYPASYWKHATKASPAVMIDGNGSNINAQLNVSHSVIGALECSESCEVSLKDSILDDPFRSHVINSYAIKGEGAIHARRVTVFGRVKARTLIAHNCAFMGALKISDKAETGDSWTGNVTDTSYFVSTYVSEPGFGAPDRSVTKNPIVRAAKKGELGSTQQDHVALREGLIRDALGLSQEGDAEEPSTLLPLGLHTQLSFVQENGKAHK